MADEFLGAGVEGGVVAGFVEAAANEEDDFGAVEGEDVGDVLVLDAAGRHGEGGEDAGFVGSEEGVGEVAAGLAAVGEASAEVGEDGGVGAVEGEEFAVEKLGKDARGAAETRVGDDGHGGVVRDDLGHEREAEKHGGDHDGADAFVLGELELLDDGGWGAHDVGHVDGLAAGGAVDLPHGFLAGADAVAKGMETLVREAVVVLDDVDAGAREQAAEDGEALGAEADGLERGAGERAVGNAGDLAQTERAELRPGQGFVAAGPVLGARELKVGEEDVVLERGVAKEDVEELRGVVAGGADGKIDDDEVLVGGDGGDGDEAAEDVLEDERVAERGAGELDGLLEEQRFDAGVEVALVRGGDVIGDAQGGPRGGGGRHGAES